MNKTTISWGCLKDALQGYSRRGEFSLLKVATNVPRPACSMARRESATRSRWRTERGRLATAATAPHGLHPPSRLCVAIQQSAGAAGAFECARCAGRLPVLFRAARQRARTRVSREDSAIVIGVSCSNFNSTRWPVGGLPPSCRATPHPRHPASGSQLRGCAKPYQNWHGSRAAREPRRSLQRLQQQRAYAHAT